MSDQLRERKVAASPATKAMAGLPDERRAALLTLSHEMNIGPHDPTWLVVRSAIDATRSEVAASRSADVIVAALDQIHHLPAQVEAELGKVDFADKLSKAVRGAIEAAAPVLHAQIQPKVDSIITESTDLKLRMRQLAYEYSGDAYRHFLDKANKHVDGRVLLHKGLIRLSTLLLIMLGISLGIGWARFSGNWTPFAVNHLPAGQLEFVIPPGWHGVGRSCKQSAAGCVIFRAPTTVQ